MTPAVPRTLVIADAEELRLLTRRHARRLHRLIVANRESLAAWLPWAAAVSLPEVRRYAARQRRLAASTGAFAAGIWVDGALAGVAALHHVDAAGGGGELGYWVAASHRGGGLAARAGHRLVEHAFGVLGLHRLEIRCAAGNLAGRAVAERLGFVLEGCLREARRLGGAYQDEVVYGLLASEHRTRLAP